MKNILVSGAGGFLGTELIHHLVQNGDVKAIALSRQKEKLEKEFGTYPNFEIVSDVPWESDVFINCVFPANANGLQLANGLDYITDLFLTAHEKAVGAVINISTQSVYSQSKNEAATEESLPDLGTKYSVGKYAVEKLTNAIFSDVPHTNLRMASLIGRNSEGRITNRFVKQVMAGKDVHIVGDVQNYGFLDVRDAADGITRYALSDTARWEKVLNLSSGHSYTLQEIAECVVREGLEFGFHSTVVVGDETGDERNSMLDGSKLEKLLNWKAEIPLEKTIRDTFAYYMKKSEDKQ